jgi:NDP-sugar pyrophosphorylase family protein
MKAMVLAAGLGERMRPLTEGRAKPSLPLLNRPIIIHTLEHLKAHGVTEVVINLHHQPESIRAVLGGGSRLGLKVHYSEEPTILGTAGGLKRAEPLLRGSGTFFMVNSDAVSDCDLGAALKKHRESGTVATLVLAPPRPGTNYGVVELGDQGRIIRIAGAPPGEPDPRSGRYTFTGIHVLEPGIFDAIPDKVKSEINREIYPALITAGRPIKGFVHSGLWRELGTPGLYIEGTMAFLRAGRDAGLAAIRASEGVYLDQVLVPADAVIDPPVLVGRGTTLGPKCSLVGGVVVGKQARLGKGCALRTTIVWDGARIGDGASLSECIVTSGVFVPPGVSLSNRIILRVEGYQGSKEKLERIGGCWMAGF